MDRLESKNMTVDEAIVKIHKTLILTMGYNSLHMQYQSSWVKSNVILEMMGQLK